MGMKTLKKTILILPILFMFCGENEETKSSNWLTTDAQSIQGLHAPENIMAACQASGLIKVSWDAFSTNATDFVIERKVEGGEFEKVGDVSADALFFSDSVVNGILYTYRVRAVIMSGTQINYVSEDYSVSASASAANLCPIIDVPVDETQVPVGFEPA